MALRTMNPNDTLLTPGQVASRWGVSLRTVQRYIALGKLPAVRLPSGHHRIRAQDAATIEGPDMRNWPRATTLDCPRCGLPEPADYCWQNRWDCLCKPPRAMDPDLWEALNELRRRIETLEQT